MLTNEEITQVHALIDWHKVAPRVNANPPPGWTYLDSGMFRDVYRFKSGEFVAKVGAISHNASEVSRCKGDSEDERVRLPLADLVWHGTQNACVMEFIEGENPKDVAARTCGWLDYDQAQRAADELYEEAYERTDDEGAGWDAADTITGPIWKEVYRLAGIIEDECGIEDAHDGNYMVTDDGTLVPVDLAM